MRLLWLADANAAVLLIGHPNKAGADFSGSTAWENQVRSRLFLDRPREADGSVIDPDARVLSRAKANYARNGEALEFRWHEWAFARQDDLPAGVGAQLGEAIAAGHDNDVFLRCLDLRTKQQRAVSENKASRTYAPREFAGMTEARGIGLARLEAAMDRLYRLQAIERGYLWDAHRKPVEGLRRAGGGRGDPRGDLALTPCSDVRRVHAPTCGDTHLPPNGGNGGAADGPPPFFDPDDIDWPDEAPENPNDD